jgi:hypothetical protein
VFKLSADTLAKPRSSPHEPVVSKKRKEVQKKKLLTIREGKESASSSDSGQELDLKGPYKSKEKRKASKTQIKVKSKSKSKPKETVIY